MNIIPTCLLPETETLTDIVSVEDARIIIEKTKGLPTTGKPAFLTDYEVLSDKIYRVVEQTEIDLSSFKHKTITEYKSCVDSKSMIQQLELFNPEKEQFNMQAFKDTCIGVPIFSYDFITTCMQVSTDVVKNINPLLNYIRAELNNNLPYNELPQIKHIYDKLEAISISVIPTTIQLSTDSFLAQRDTKGLPLYSLGYTTSALVDVIAKFDKFASLNTETLITVVDDILTKYLNVLVDELKTLDKQHTAQSTPDTETINEYLKVFHRVKLIYSTINILQTLMTVLISIGHNLSAILYYFERNIISKPQVSITADGNTEPYVIEYEPEYTNM